MSKYLTLDSLRIAGNNIKDKLMPNITSSTTDYIIEQGTQNGFNYRKGKNGFLEIGGYKWYENASGTSGADNNQRSILICADTDPVQLVGSDRNVMGVGALTGHASSSLCYCRLSYSTDMGANPTPKGYYADCYIYSGGNYTCNGGVYLYVTGTWK